MKKRIALIVSIFSLIALLFVLGSCGHEHEYKAEWEKDANNHWHACSVDGEECDSVLDSAPHKFEKVVVKAATCVSTGEYYEKCNVCGYKKATQTINKTEHNWKDATCQAPKTCISCGLTEGEAAEHTWVDATCQAPKTCSACNITEGTALEHSWKDATCQAPKTCSACNTTEGTALEHSWKDATCQAPKTCTACNTTEGELGEHNWNDATCLAPKTCSVCNATEGEKGEHNWSDATCLAPKTCSICNATEGGLGEHAWAEASCLAPKTCSVCNATEGEKSEHSWSEATCTEPKTCTVCKETEGKPLGHTYNFDGNMYIEFEQPTCTTPGIKYYTCTVCFETPSDEENAKEIAALGHDYKYNVIKPDCLLGGYTEVECSRCDYYATESPVEALGHSYNFTNPVIDVDYVITLEPTCTEDGTRAYICTVCSTQATDGDGVAAEPMIGHNMQVSQGPWCGNKGITEYACVNSWRGTKCPETNFDEATEEYRHSYAGPDAKIPATCCENGLFVCEACGTDFVAYEGDEYGQATNNHVYDVLLDVVPATCIAKGYSLFGCSAGNCGTSAKDNETDLVAHILGGVSDFGTVSCTVCNKSYVDVSAEKKSGTDNMCMGCGQLPCVCEGVTGGWEGYIKPSEPEQITANTEFTKTDVQWSDSTVPLAIGGGLIIINTGDVSTTITVTIYENGESTNALHIFDLMGDYVMIDLSEHEIVGKVVIMTSNDSTVSFYSVI